MNCEPVDDSFLVDNPHLKSVLIGNACVIEGPSDRPSVRVDLDGTRGTDNASQTALDLFRIATAEVDTTTVLTSGDLIILDSRVALHGRTPFEPRYDGTDRWLMRTFITRDLESSRAGRLNDGRVVTYDHSADPDVVEIVDRSGRRMYRADQLSLGEGAQTTSSSLFSRCVRRRSGRPPVRLPS